MDSAGLEVQEERRGRAGLEQEGSKQATARPGQREAQARTEAREGRGAMELGVRLGRRTRTGQVCLFPEVTGVRVAEPPTWPWERGQGILLPLVAQTPLCFSLGSGSSDLV